MNDPRSGIAGAVGFGDRGILSRIGGEILLQRGACVVHLTRNPGSEASTDLGVVHATRGWTVNLEPFVYAVGLFLGSLGRSSRGEYEHHCN